MSITKEQVEDYQKPIHAGVNQILQEMDDSENPVITFIGFTIRESGEVRDYRHGAVSFWPTQRALSFLQQHLYEDWIETSQLPIVSPVRTEKHYRRTFVGRLRTLPQLLRWVVKGDGV